MATADYSYASDSPTVPGAIVLDTRWWAGVGALMLKKGTFGLFIYRHRITMSKRVSVISVFFFPGVGRCTFAQIDGIEHVPTTEQ